MASDLLREFGDTAGVAIPKRFIFDLGEDVTYVKTNKDEAPKNEQNSAAYYLLPPTAVNRIKRQRELAVQDKISIHSKTAISYDHVSPETLAALHTVCKPANLIKIYSATLEPLVAVKNKIVVVHQINRRQITIIGSSFDEPTVLWYPEDEKFVPFKEGDFVQVGCIPLESDVTMGCVSNRLRGTGEFSGKQVLDFWDFKFYTKAFKRSAVEANEETGNIRYFPIDVKPITSTELDYINTRLQSKEEISYEDTVRYIKEPAIAAFMLENVFEEDARETVTIRTNPELMLNENKILHFVLNLDVEQRELLVETRSRYQWRIGIELMVRHSQLKTNSTGGSRVTLVGCKRSEKIMQVIMENNKIFSNPYYKFAIGPQKMYGMTTKMIKERFDDFYEKKDLFMAYCGHLLAPKVELKGLEDFFVNGRPLDPSQLHFLRAAASSPGWTCAQAPPGCGKTHITSALVACLNDMAKQGENIRGVVISGTTNAAVTNAADAVKANFREISIIRDFSSKAESEAGENSLGHSLTKMARNAKDYLNLEKFPLVEEVLNRLEIKEQIWESGSQFAASKNEQMRKKKAVERIKQLDVVETTERSLKKTFLKHYNIQVYATTAELLVRKGNESSIFGGEEAENDEKLNNTIERIIIDESTQLNPVEALAIYCTFRNLKYITLLGDIFQLGPHSRLDPKSQAYAYMTVGELNRMINLPSVTKCSLKRVYRCHPTITEVFLKPIYGDEIEVGTKSEDRNLAKKNNIFRAKDGSPFGLIHLISEEIENTNSTEMVTVMALINHLIFQKEISRDDIVILTYHRAQRDYIAAKLKNQNSPYSTETIVPVYTVDSFQGKETKIVILCTTKTANGTGQYQAKLQFIGDPKRVTVAISRAQHALYVLGDWTLLAKSAFWRKIIIKATKADSGPFLNSYFDQHTDVMIKKLRLTTHNKSNQPPQKPKKNAELTEKEKAAVAKHLLENSRNKFRGNKTIIPSNKKETKKDEIAAPELKIDTLSSSQELTEIKKKVKIIKKKSKAGESKEETQKDEKKKKIRKPKNPMVEAKSAKDVLEAALQDLMNI